MSRHEPFMQRTLPPPTRPEAHVLLGKSFRCDFTVTELGASPSSDPENPARVVMLTSDGVSIQWTLGMLRAAVALGFVEEV